MTFKQILLSIKDIWGDSLYLNSFYLILSQLVLAVLGFFFWIIATHFYSSYQVGIATTLISVTGLITSLSMLGFNQAIVRYFSTEEYKNHFVNTSYMAVTIGSICLTLIFIFGVNFFSPPLLFIKNNIVLCFFLIVFMVLATLNTLTDSIFIALRNSKFILLVNCFVGVTKLALPVLLLSLGTLGIFYAYTTSVIVGAVLSLIFLRFYFSLHLYPTLNLNVLSRVWRFSLGNYVAGIFSLINATLIPLLITNRLGPSVTAYYYMPSMIMTILVAIPRSTSSSMFAEGSLNSKRLWPLFLRTLKISYMILIPAALINIFFGQYILLAFGKNYSVEGIFYLRCVILGLVISLPNYFIGTVFNIEKRIRLQLKFGVFGAFLGIFLTLVFIPYGLNGLGISAIVGQSVMLILSLIVFFRTRRNLYNFFTL